MKTNASKTKTVNEYIAQAPQNSRQSLKRLRATIRRAAPQADETISYGMPAYKLSNKPLAYFAIFSNHIGFYATPNGQRAFAKELAGYKQGKGSVQFPLNKVPLSLIFKMVTFNRKEAEKKVDIKSKVATVGRPRQPMPTFVRQALNKHRLLSAYNARPPYQRNDYLGWINNAVRPETKQKRLNIMLAELKQGYDYMGLKWSPRK